jgi:hypothetical protein
VGDREERNAPERHPIDPGVRVEHRIEQQVPAFMGGKPCHGPAQKRHNRGSAVLLWSHRLNGRPL